MKVTEPIAPLLELEALKQAVRWPNPSLPTISTLVGQFLAAHRDADAYAYFAERVAEHPDQPLFLALEGVFQARMAGGLPFFRRPAWVREALSKLDRAVERDPGLTTYFRGVVQADLPGMFRRRKMAVSDLEWVLAHKEQFPIGLRRGVYFGLAKAYAALGHAKAAHEALQQSGVASLDGDAPVFVTDSWMTADDGFRFTTPRLLELAVADVVVFDPLSVAERSTYADPHQYPSGIAHVIVAGRLVIRAGKSTGARPGRVLRRA